MVTSSNQESPQAPGSLADEFHHPLAPCSGPIEPISSKLESVEQCIKEWSNGVKDNSFDSLVEILGTEVLQDEVITPAGFEGRYGEFQGRQGTMRISFETCGMQQTL